MTLALSAALAVLAATNLAGCGGGDDAPLPLQVGDSAGNGNGAGDGGDGGDGGGGSGGGSQPNVTSVASFGDSLSDLGSYRWGSVEAAGGGRYTNNPGPIWIEQVASHYGAAIAPNRTGGAGNPSPQVLGGLGYAQGGARVTMLPGVGITPSGIADVSVESAAWPIREQIAAHLGLGPIPASQLVLVFGGANDVLFQAVGYMMALEQGTSPADAGQRAVAEVATAAGDLAAAVESLAAAGAQKLVVVDAPDLAVTPYGIEQDPELRAMIAELTRRFNGALGAGLAGIPGVQRIDFNAFLADAIAQPQAYGFVDVATRGCSVPSLVCTSQTLSAPGAAQTFLFADGVHPSAAGHAAFARHVLDRIAAAIPR